jgi:hypothetical protein
MSGGFMGDGCCKTHSVKERNWNSGWAVPARPIQDKKSFGCASEMRFEGSDARPGERFHDQFTYRTRWCLVDLIL